MYKSPWILLLSMLMLAGCADLHLPPLPGDAAAKRFETVADRAVIYVARDRHDKDFVAPLLLDDQWIGPTYRGTYLRIVVPAGTHRLAGYAGDSGFLQFTVDPGGLYFIDHHTSGFRSLDRSSFALARPDRGRAMVLSGTLNDEVIR